MLDLALQLDWEGQDKVYEGQARNIALLYEYWLVFQLIDILKKLGAEFGFDIQKEAGVKQMISFENGLVISLKEGQASLISALLKDKNIKINFYYNRTFYKKDFDGTDYQGSYSRPFRPDYTLAVFPSDCKKEKEAIENGSVTYIHFDAKYRVTDITSLFGNEIDKEEDVENELNEEKKQESINTYKRGDLLKMHTYNDAIRRTVGSYVLYPGIETQRPYTVYDELLPGVGAFAIRPSNIQDATSVLSDFILKIIDHQSSKVSRIAKLQDKENLIIRENSEMEKFTFNCGKSSVSYEIKRNERR